MQDLEHDVLGLRWRATLALAGLDPARALPVGEAAAVLTDAETLGLSDAGGVPIGWITVSDGTWQRETTEAPATFGEALRAVVAAGVTLPEWLLTATVAPGFSLAGPPGAEGTPRLFGGLAEPLDGRADVHLFGAVCHAAGLGDGDAGAGGLDALATTRGAERQWLILARGAAVGAVGMRIAPAAERTLRWLRPDGDGDAAIPRAVRDALGVRDLRAIWVLRDAAGLRALAEWTLAPST